MNKSVFIEKIKPGAIQSYVSNHIRASLTIAQAILESGWGESLLTKNANNLFGIKALAGQRAYNIDTREVVNGRNIIVKSCAFRAYSSWTESVSDHTRLLLTPRYARVINAKNYVEACTMIKACGYATDPNYAKLLIQLIEQNNLQELDLEVTMNSSQLPVLRFNQSGKFVNLLQKYLNKSGEVIAIDGIFGVITLLAVKNFQRKKKLSIDGIVGRATWKSLTA